MQSTTVVSIQTAKTQFDDLLERVSRGGEIVITLDDHPVARLSPIRAKRKPLPYGLLKGKPIAKANFGEPLAKEEFAVFGTHSG